jgi:hypothetical protein
VLLAWVLVQAQVQVQVLAPGLHPFEQNTRELGRV